MRALAVVLGLLVAGLAVLLMTKSERESDLTSTEATAVTEERVLADIATLRAEIRELRSVLGRSPETREPAERADAGEDAGLRTELAGIAERLDRLLERGFAPARSVPLLRDEGAGFPSIEAVWAVFDAGRPPLAVFPGDSTPSILGGLTREHFLWPLERVIEAYGAPDGIYPDSGGVMVKYQREPSGGRVWLIEFLLAEGRVVRVGASR